MPRLKLDRDVLRYTLGNRDFSLLWGDSIGNGFGMSGEQVVLSLLVYQFTQSSAWVGITLALYFAPSLVVGAVAGSIADWMDRRDLVRRCELGIAVMIGLFGCLLAFDIVSTPILLAMALVSGFLRALYAPARLSYAYDLVGSARAVGGLSMLNIGFRIGQLLGALLAGFIAERYGAAQAYFAVAIAHWLAYLALTQLRTSGIAAERDTAPFTENVRTMFSEMRHNRNLALVMLVMVGVGILGFSYVTVLPELATQALGAGAQALGLMYAARAGGGLIGVCILTAIGLTDRRGALLIGTVALFGSGIIMLGSSASFAIITLALFITAATSAVYDVLTQSVMQIIVPNKLRGRAMGIWVFVIGIEPLGHILLGTTAALLGVALALQVNGGVLLLMGIALLIGSPRLRRL